MDVRDGLVQLSGVCCGYSYVLTCDGFLLCISIYYGIYHCTFCIIIDYVYAIDMFRPRYFIHIANIDS